MNHMTRPPRSGALCNESYAELGPAERAAMVEGVKAHVERMFDVLGVDHVRCHNTNGTAERFAKMLVEETMAGRYAAPPRLTDFDNAARYEGMIVTGPIAVRSTCAHHMMPIVGEAYVGVIPDASGRIIGLSKYDRVVEHFAARLQIQEELVDQIAEHLARETSPKGVAVRVSAVHMCKTHRGVRAPLTSRMVTTATRGTMAEAANRAAFVAECAMLEARR